MKNQICIRILFYFSWILLNIIQAFFTDLLYDEAYYWYGSFHMDWGHFYYSPFIDLLSYAGYSLIENELGLRLFYILFNSLAIFLLEKLINVKKLLTFYGIVSSIIFLQVGGFFAAPDIPLFFFGVCFFIVLKNYTNNNSYKNALLLGLFSALLLYTKYHGIIIIATSFLYILPKFYKNKSFYVWPIFSIILFIPHVIWQFQNEFPTVKFHLLNRPGTRLFNIHNLDYIPGQLLFMGPIVGFILLYAVFKGKTQNYFERIIKFNLITFYVFFLLISIYTHIEINWGVLGLIPLIILGYYYISKNNHIEKILYKTVPISIVLAVIFRLALFFAEASPVVRLDKEFSGWDTFASAIDSVAQGAPVVMMSRYQPASKFAFHSESKFVHVIFPNQPSDFILFDTGEKVQSKNVVLCSPYKFSASTEVKTNKGSWYFKLVPNFRSYTKIELINIGQTSGENGELLLTLKNPYPYDISFEENKNIKSHILVKIWSENEKEKTIKIGDAKDFLNKEKKVTVKLPKDKNGNYQFFIRTGSLMPMPCSKEFNFVSK